MKSLIIFANNDPFNSWLAKVKQEMKRILKFCQVRPKYSKELQL